MHRTMSERPARLLETVAAQLSRAVGDARGVLVDEARRCGGCRVLAKPMWRFRRASAQPGASELWLCARCKAELDTRRARARVEPTRRERKRGSYVDAMARALHAGSFEANRRRH